MTAPNCTPRRAGPADAVEVATLLDAFNREFATPTPGVGVLADRLERLLAGDELVAVLAGTPAVGLALLSIRPSVWYDGPVAVLDELYVRPGLRGHGTGGVLVGAVGDLLRERGVELLEVNVDGEDIDARRFYEAHGFSNSEPGQSDPLLYYYLELVAVPGHEERTG